MSTASRKGGRLQRRSHPMFFFLFALCAGCSRQDTLRPGASIAIGDAPLNDLLGGAGEIVWLSGRDAPVALRLASEDAHRLEPGIGGGARMVGEVDGQLLVVRDRALVGVHPDSAAPYRLQQGVETAVLVPTHGILLQSIAEGEIVVTPLDHLRPGWGWGGLGAVSTALAVSPDGDRLYQALDRVPPDEKPRLLVRDLLSGRILTTIDLDEPVRALAVTAAGDLIMVGRDAEESTATVNRLTWEEGELRTAWTSYLPAPTSIEDFRLAITPNGDRIAVVGTNDEAGLTLLEGETGFTIADFNAPTRDATFDERGRLYAVTDSAVLRLE